MRSARQEACRPGAKRDPRSRAGRRYREGSPPGGKPAISADDFVFYMSNIACEISAGGAPLV